MPIASQSVGSKSHPIRRCPQDNRDLALGLHSRRVSFPDQLWTCSELRTATCHGLLENGNPVANPFGALPPFASRGGREPGSKRSPRLPGSYSSLHTINPSEPDVGLAVKNLDGLSQSISLELDDNPLKEAYHPRLSALSTQKRGKDLNRTNEAVFGVSLLELSKCAFTSALFNGRQLRLPTVVFNCVEELYRTGIYQPDLFRTLPCRKRLSELVRIFNSPDPHTNYHQNSNRRSKVTEYNATLLYLESTQDICALLSEYLYALPAPLVPPYLLDAIWEAGDLNKDRTDEYDSEPDAIIPIEATQRRQSAPSLVRTYTDEWEVARIKTVQNLLCSLPLPNLSLLVYLLAFFSHVAMMRDVNGASTQELGRLFGRCIFGGRGQYQPSSEESSKDGKTIMCWFLQRWGILSNGLFDILEACPRKQQSFMTWMVPENLTIPVHANMTPASNFTKRQRDHSSPLSQQPSISPKDVPGSHSINVSAGFCKSETDEHMDTLSLSKEHSEVKKLQGEKDHESEDPQAPSLSTTSEQMSRQTSVYSASDIDERLLDVVCPALFDTCRVLDNVSSESLTVVQTSIANQPTANGSQEQPRLELDDDTLLHAQAKILNLELQLVKSDAMVAQAMEVMFRAKRRIDEIDDRLEMLANVLRCRSAELPLGVFGLGGDGKACKERFDTMLLERRQAYEDVIALRKLMSAEL